MFPGNAGYLKEAYEDAVINQKYGYLLVDLSQQTSDKYRLQTNILPTQSRIIYKEK
jgi:hypothetical protein